MNRIISILCTLLLIQFLVVKKVFSDEVEVKDCFETLNRATFALNMGLDKVFFKPVSKGYRKLPSPIRTGTSNALNNLSNLITVPNNILQGDFSSAANNTIRFVINSTIGIVGIFDPANTLGFKKGEKEDFGQSFAKHGMGPGCYLVLPVLGPSTARDTISSTLNFVGGDAWYNLTVRNDTQYFSDIDYYTSKVTEGVNFRAKNFDDIESLKENSLDFYASVKSLYLQDRQQKILNTKKIIETQNDSDWEEIDSQ